MGRGSAPARGRRESARSQPRASKQPGGLALAPQPVGRSSRPRPVSRGRAREPRAGQGGGARGSESRGSAGRACRVPDAGRSLRLGWGQGGPLPSGKSTVPPYQIARGPTSRLPQPALDPEFHLPPRTASFAFRAEAGGESLGRSQGGSSPPPTLRPGLWDAGPPPRRVSPRRLGAGPPRGERAGPAAPRLGSVGPSWPLAAAAAPWRPQRRGAADFGLGRWRGLVTPMSPLPAVGLGRSTESPTHRSRAMGG